MKNIYVSTRGQEDNIGDSILRRCYLDALRSVGRLHILVSHFDSYNSGLGLRIASMLGTQLGGTLTTPRLPDALFVLEFPEQARPH